MLISNKVMEWISNILTKYHITVLNIHKHTLNREMLGTSINELQTTVKDLEKKVDSIDDESLKNINVTTIIIFVV